MALYDANRAFISRSDFISAANNLYSSPVQVASIELRHESILLPHVVSVSPLQFVKSVPHFSCIQARRPESQALRPPAVVDVVAVFIALCASNSARC